MGGERILVVDDVARTIEANKRLRSVSQSYIPEEHIPLGDETARLHRYGDIP